MPQEKGGIGQTVEPALWGCIHAARALSEAESARNGEVRKAHPRKNKVLQVLRHARIARRVRGPRRPSRAGGRGRTAWTRWTDSVALADVLRAAQRAAIEAENATR